MPLPALCFREENGLNQCMATVATERGRAFEWQGRDDAAPTGDNVSLRETCVTQSSRVFTVFSTRMLTDAIWHNVF